MIIDDSSSQHLVFDQGSPIVVLDLSSQKTRTIEVRNGTRLTWYSVTDGAHTAELSFTTYQGETQVRALIMAGESGSPTLRIASHLVENAGVTNVHIVSLVAESGRITVDGSIHIHEGIAGVSGHILEENIFLGSSGSIRGIPSLFVHSDDVEAGHAARIERVSDEKLYYLRARGMPRDDATMVMIGDTLARLFDGLEPQYYDQIWGQVIGALGRGR